MKQCTAGYPRQKRTLALLVTNAMSSDWQRLIPLRNILLEHFFVNAKFGLPYNLAMDDTALLALAVLFPCD